MPSISCTTSVMNTDYFCNLGTHQNIKTALRTCVERSATLSQKEHRPSRGCLIQPALSNEYEIRVYILWRRNKSDQMKAKDPEDLVRL